MGGSVQAVQRNKMLGVVLRVFLGIGLCFLSGVNAFSQDLHLAVSSDAFNRGDFATAKDGYLLLYEETKDIAYAKQAAMAAASMGDLQTATKLAFLYQNITKNTQDVATNKILVDSYIRMGDVKKAISLLEFIKEKEDSLSVDNILGTLYLSQKEVDKAYQLLNGVYNETHDEVVLEKILTIYLAKNDKVATINLMTSHLKNYGCSDDLCKKSIDLFLRLGEVFQAEKIFSSIYEKSPTIESAGYFIWILTYQKKYKQAQEIAQKFPLNRHLLLDLYVAQKDFASASKQASLIYQEKKSPKYLALEAVYQYEAMESLEKTQGQSINAVIKKLELAIKERKKEASAVKENFNEQDAFFYNFLGYMLIDYDLDIKKGLDYVKVALSIDPSSISYVDSLAWGYYKLGKCAEAKKVFSTIPNENIQNEDELKIHFERINSCIKN